MRGKARFPMSSRPQKRITPAYAGKSSGLWNRECQRKDHPRLCGEKYFYMNEENREKGSPPPMRGKVLRFAQKAYVSGITPAYAGKSQSDFLH